MKVHLVDGQFEIFRCFHGAPRARHDGREVGAGRAFVQTLAALLRQDDVTHLAVAFDRAIAPVRVPDTPEGALQSQYGLAADIVRALGIAIWPMIRYQADEALATGAALYKAHADVVLCTTDKDLAQCVDGTRVVLLDRIRKRVTDEAAVRERFGVTPRQIPEYFALVGDPSDGLPGIPGWGPKSAAAALTHFGTLEDIPLDPTRWPKGIRGAQRLADTLRERLLEARLYRALSVRRCDLPLPHTLDDLRWRGPNLPRLRQLTEHLGDDSVLARVPPRRS